MRYYKRITIEGATNGLVVKDELIDAADGTCEGVPTTSVYKAYEELVIGLAYMLLPRAEAKRMKRLILCGDKDA